MSRTRLIVIPQIYRRDPGDDCLETDGARSTAAIDARRIRLAFPVERSGWRRRSAERPIALRPEVRYGRGNRCCWVTYQRAVVVVVAVVLVRMYNDLVSVAWVNRRSFGPGRRRPVSSAATTSFPNPSPRSWLAMGFEQAVLTSVTEASSTTNRPSSSSSGATSSEKASPCARLRMGWPRSSRSGPTSPTWSSWTSCSPGSTGSRSAGRSGRSPTPTCSC